MKLGIAAAVACALLVAQQREPRLQLVKHADANEWLEAAAAHQPGAADAPLRKIESWPGNRLAAALEAVRATPASDLLNQLLERAALLHADISLRSRHTGKPPSTDGWEFAGRSLLVQDGQPIGFRPLDPQIRFGRNVLAAIRVPRSHAGERQDPAAERQRILGWEAAHRNNPRIRQWFKAIAADLAARHWLADLGPHLESGSQMLPGDAGVRFDSGCLAEVMASKQVQHAASLPSSTPRRDSLADAEKHYRAALERDPQLSEARVRLARVLTLKNRPRDAIELLRANSDSQEPEVKYYGALALADAAEKNGQLQAARDAYARASALFPGAQSPLIANARLARETGDDSGARDATARISALSSLEAHRLDPWWTYYDCNGRNREIEIETLWALFRQAQR